MIFFGTDKSLREFRQIIIDEFDVRCTEVTRGCFGVRLTKEQRMWLQENVWNRAEPDAPTDALDRPMRWSWRIAFSE